LQERGADSSPKGAAAARIRANRAIVSRPDTQLGVIRLIV
jgi:hypothetical protein